MTKEKNSLEFSEFKKATAPKGVPTVYNTAGASDMPELNRFNKYNCVEQRLQTSALQKQAKQLEQLTKQVERIANALGMIMQNQANK